MATAETLYHQSYQTARSYMREAIAFIDEEFGKGYSAAHPELVASFIETAAYDYRTASQVNDQESLRGSIEEAVTALHRLADK